MKLSEEAQRNRRVWTKANAEYTDRRAAEAWATPEIEWGMWGVPESELRAIGEISGKDVIELGCGTAYWSAWLARRGARPTGVDISDGQLASARRFQAEFGVEFPLVQASAESVPLPRASADLVLSEYGASIWADPYRWIPEASRLLRPGGALVFLVNATLLMLCIPPSGEPASERLARDLFGMHRFEWPDDDSVEFHLSYGDMIRLLRANGFEVEDLLELRPAADATTRYPFVTNEWARRWPCEEIWKARKR